MGRACRASELEMQPRCELGFHCSLTSHYTYRNIFALCLAN